MGTITQAALRADSYYRPRRRRAVSFMAFGLTHALALLLNITALHGQFGWDRYMFWISIPTIIVIAAFYVCQSHDDRLPDSAQSDMYSTPRKYDR